MWNKKVINEWSEKTNIKKHFKVFISFFIEWENQQIIEKKMKKEIKQQKKEKKNGKFPGTGSPSWLGLLLRYNALPTELRGTCHERRVNVKIICDKLSSYCKEQRNKDSEEKGFWLKKTLL